METNLKDAYDQVSKNRDLKIEKAKIRHDRQVRPAKYKVGDTVWLSVEKVKQGLNKRLHKKWVGPYEITQIIGPVNYKIKPLHRRGYQLVVHRSRLKRCFMRVEQLQDQDAIDNNVQVSHQDQINIVDNNLDNNLDQLVDTANISNNDVISRSTSLENNSRSSYSLDSIVSDNNDRLDTNNIPGDNLDNSLDINTAHDEPDDVSIYSEKSIKLRRSTRKKRPSDKYNPSHF